MDHLRGHGARYAPGDLSHDFFYIVRERRFHFKGRNQNPTGYFSRAETSAFGRFINQYSHLVRRVILTRERMTIQLYYVKGTQAQHAEQKLLAKASWIMLLREQEAYEEQVDQLAKSG